jgi:hypothetical protein
MAVSVGDLSILSLIARVVVGTSNRQGAEQLLPALVAHRRRFASWGMVGMAIEGPIAGRLAEVLALLGREDEADQAFEEARAASRAAGARPEAAWLAFEHATLLRRSAVAERNGRARAALDEAGELAHALSLDVLTEMVSESGSEVGAATPRARSSDVARFRMWEEGEIWCFECDGARFSLKDRKGLRLLAHLVDNPGREIHVLDLERGGDVDAPRADGDAGEVIDKEARDAYRRRAAELRDELEEAEAWNDPGRCARAREELEAIEAELRSALGLGGRARKSASAAERARVNTQRRLRDAMKRIADEHAQLGRHLERTIRTGTFCSYEP